MKLQAGKAFAAIAVLAAGLMIQAVFRQGESAEPGNAQALARPLAVESEVASQSKTVITSPEPGFVAGLRRSSEAKSEEIRDSVRKLGMHGDGKGSDVEGLLKEILQEVLGSSKTLEGRQVFASTVLELSRSPEAVALLQRSLADQDYLKSRFGKDQSLVRVIGLKVLDQSCKDGDPDAAVEALRSLVSDYLAVPSPLPGRTADIENLTYSIASTTGYQSLEALHDLILNQLDLDQALGGHADPIRLQELKTELYRGIVSANLDKRRDVEFIQGLKKLLKIGIHS